MTKITNCALTTTLNLIGGKYKIEILYYLTRGTKRFNELQKYLPKATAKVLSSKLKELEEDGFIDKKIYPVIPPKTEYSLTERGKSLAPLILAIYEWGTSYFKEIGHENLCNVEELERLSQLVKDR